MILSLNNPHPKILVVGDLMIDHYLWGNCDRISPEAPVQVIDIQKETTTLGGAGNVVNNLIALGAQVDIASVIGEDDPGLLLTAILASVGAGRDLIIKQKERKTSKKSRVIASHQQVIRFDCESKEPISSETESLLTAAIQSVIHKYEVVILSDYAKGVLTETFCQSVIKLARASGKKVLVDPKGKDYRKYKGAFLITPNRKEASLATNINVSNDNGLREAGFYLRNNLELNYAVVTLSEDGIALFGEEMTKIPTKAKDVYDVTGAGDTVLASLGFALANDNPILESCKFANYAAAVVVGKVGSATATLEEIQEYYLSEINPSSQPLIKSISRIVQIASTLKSEGRKIVFTYGPFNNLHLDLVKMLEKAKTSGDVLIVGVNSNFAVKESTNEESAYLIASLKAVDYVVTVNDDTLHQLITLIQPDVLIDSSQHSITF